MEERVKHISTTETGKHALMKFVYVLIIFIAYTLFVILKYGSKDGLLVSLLTWSFFVFCTPIADAGFLVAFPLRVLFNIRMTKTQIGVYVVAGLITLYSIVFETTIFGRTILLRLFREILMNPIPNWIILLLSFIGTFLSIYFGDELFEVAYHRDREKFHKHSEKHKFIITLTIIILTIISYKFLIETMGINIPLL